MTSESKVKAWDRYTIMVGLNQLMASELSSFWQLDLQQQYRYTVYFNNIPETTDIQHEILKITDYDLIVILLLS